MVESKTVKRKAAAKVAARAAHEMAVERKAKKDKEAAAAPSPSGISPIAGRTRGGAIKKQTPAKAKTPPSSGGKKRKAGEEEEEEKEEEMDLALKNEEEEEEEGANGEEEEEVGGDGFSSQRLVVKLESKQQQQLSSKLKKIKPAPKAAPIGAANQAESSVVYLGRVPYGFFEEEMREYFTQFGVVRRLRLSRNKKTGKSKHYAFIEFEHPEVASIVAETHDKMLIADRAVSCALVPAHKIHPELFKGADKPFRKINWKAAAKKASKTKRTPQKEKARVKGLVKREQVKRKKLQEVGIELEFAGYEGLRDARQPKRKRLDAEEAE